jgi:tetratricopeptide (TPR) repeat protein
VLTYATGHYPGSAGLRVAFGVAQYATGDYTNAVKTLCEAIDLNPEDPRPLEFLGKMDGVAPELSAEVRSRLQHFAVTYKNSAAANYYYAMSLLHMQDYQSAKQFLQRSIALQPDFAEAHYELGTVCEQAGDSESAISEFKKAVSLQPTMSAPHYHLARLYQKTGQTALAGKEFSAVKNLHDQ